MYVPTFYMTLWRVLYKSNMREYSMKRKTKFAAIFFCIIGVLLITSCAALFGSVSTDSSETRSASQETQSTASGTGNAKANQPAQRTPPALYTGTGGKGIVIAVPAPVLQGGTRADDWMSQHLQDLITGDLARYSAMTVIDRQNEQMAIAEQNLSASENYSDDNYIKIGNLTNAKFIVVGSIRNVSGRYNVSFRINNSETNEIKAAFNKPYQFKDIETGLAAKEAVKELLMGMGDIVFRSNDLFMIEVR